MIKKIGKIGKLNIKEGRELAKLWIEKDIRWCEFDKLHMCYLNMGLQNAHRHKKRWYLGKPDTLRWSINQAARLCQVSHHYIEFNAKRTATFFKRLRGPEVGY